MADDEKTKARPTHSIEPNEGSKQPSGNHEVEAPEESTDDEAGGDDPKTTKRQE